MNFIEATKAGFLKYFDFESRAGRSEFWFFFAFMILAGSILTVVESQLFPQSERPTAGLSFSLGVNSANGPISAIFSILIVIPWFSVTARRVHDIGKTGWWMAFGMIPVLGWVTMLIFLGRESDGTANKYGHTPSLAS